MKLKVSINIKTSIIESKDNQNIIEKEVHGIVKSLKNVFTFSEKATIKCFAWDQSKNGGSCCFTMFDECPDSPCKISLSE